MQDSNSSSFEDMPPLDEGPTLTVSDFKAKAEALPWTKEHQMDRLVLHRGDTDSVMIGYPRSLTDTNLDKYPGAFVSDPFRHLGIMAELTQGFSVRKVLSRQTD